VKKTVILQQKRGDRKTTEGRTDPALGGPYAYILKLQSGEKKGTLESRRRMREKNGEEEKRALLRD